MRDIHQQLEEGASFEALAQEYSQSSFASEGGELGLFAIDDLSVALQKEIRGLGAGEFTPVIETGQGYQIFLVQEIVRPPAVALEQAMPQIRQKLYREKLNQRFEVWVKELREQAHIKITM